MQLGAALRLEGSGSGSDAPCNAGISNNGIMKHEILSVSFHGLSIIILCAKFNFESGINND